MNPSEWREGARHAEGARKLRKGSLCRSLQWFWKRYTEVRGAKRRFTFGRQKHFKFLSRSFLRRFFRAWSSGIARREDASLVPASSRSPKSLPILSVTACNVNVGLMSSPRLFNQVAFGWYPVAIVVKRREHVLQNKRMQVCGKAGTHKWLPQHQQGSRGRKTRVTFLPFRRRTVGLRLRRWFLAKWRSFRGCICKTLYSSFKRGTDIPDDSSTELLLAFFRSATRAGAAPSMLENSVLTNSCANFSMGSRKRPTDVLQKVSLVVWKSVATCGQPTGWP